MNLQQQVAALTAEQRAAKTRAVRQLVADIAAGKEVSPEEVLAICEAAGWDQTKLFAEVERLEQFERDRAIVNGAEDFREQRREISRERESLEKQRLAAIETHKAKMAELDVRDGKIQRKARDVEEARKRMMDAAPQSLHAELRAAVEDRAFHSQKRIGIDTQYRETGARLGDDRRALEHDARQTVSRFTPDQAKTIKASIEANEKLHAELGDRLAEIDETIAACSERMEEIKRTMIGAA